ncbi:MAG: tetratricopeptide repeat protein [Deltaproteobacteria bacterium]|jgi:tetratricopeptide (TPR) repeat protein|nr:tetratricopeptide repeat protein [Deltaproteobacteria bacterium]MBT4642003.1 tetratricopeptide repeat protein [Deltaproteobacteria bacterium]MBT6499597.1 tetratricopeptide repeat protein [Deltaproteobacteria bacterium]MBT6612013.1 tetratricopeptide repeat protein [Deltaproteobacteria bacterium]MBT7151446.1 tetratricopeptide repeat protein [Deltaproteobacteria bacterium]
MFKNIRQSKEEKSLQSIEKHLTAGLKQLSRKMHNGAMIEFGKAMAIDSNIVYPKLCEELEKVAVAGEFESAIAIGMNLIKEKKGDYELINKLGNYAQRLKDFKQAIALYKTALKIKKDYKPAFYNLASAEVKAEIVYDDIINELSQFKDQTEYILPSYIGDDNLIAGMMEKASSSKPKEVEAKIRQLFLLRDKKTESGGQAEVRKIDAKIEKLKEDAGKVTVDDVCHEFRKKIKLDAKNEQTHLFNLGLYAVANQKADVAEDALKGLSAVDFPTSALLLALSQEQKGNPQEAIQKLIQLLAENEFNRYYNVNLGLIYRKVKKQFLSVKYLIKTAVLLRKSDGMYSMRKLMQEADVCFEEGNFEKALDFYLIAVTEQPDSALWNKIGIIYRNLKQIDEAINTFRDVLKKDPDSETANQQMREIHDYYINTGDTLFEENKFKPAAEYFDRALSILRLPESLKKAAQAYRQLNDIKTEKMLLEEAENILNAEKEKGQERLRQALIIKGRGLLKKGQYQKAIEIIEAAFDMKADKDVYRQLATLYKKFKGKDSLSGLEKRWSDMVLQKERQEALEKEEEREQKAKSDKI